MAIQTMSKRILASVERTLLAGKSETTVRAAMRHYYPDMDDETIERYIRLAAAYTQDDRHGRNTQLLEEESIEFKRFKKAGNE